jgi:hypothetical protein
MTYGDFATIIWFLLLICRCDVLPVRAQYNEDGSIALHQPEMENVVSLFWQQMEWVRPESYVADNDYLNFVSMNKALFSSVHDAVKALSTR